MNAERKKILNRLYLASFVILLLGISVIIKMSHIFFVEGKECRKQVKSSNIKKREIPANRGNIYSSDGELLSTTLTKYNIAIDLKVVSETLFSNHVRALADSLGKLSNKLSSKHYLRRLQKGRTQRKQYVLLKRNLDFSQYKRVLEFPILKEGRFKGGLIVEPQTKRVKPMLGLASRTVGFDDERGKAGLEGGYSRLLRGEKGYQIMQKIADNHWKPLDGLAKKDPLDGADIISTIHSRFQEIAHFALLKGLKKFQADHGSAIVMEVKTGRVVALANLGKTKSGKGYYEKINYAVYEASEPGSTFKLITLMAVLEDGFMDMTDTINTGNGVQEFYGKTIRDSRYGGYGRLSVSEVLEVSSNVGIAKIVWKHYKENPERLINHFRKWNLDKKLDIHIPGEGAPMIPNPKSEKWSGISLPWLAHGYGLHMTPLQIITFYNAVANDGKMVSPIFVDKINGKHSDYTQRKKTKISKQICLEKTIKKAQSMLRNVVLKGNIESLNKLPISIAGKTGTTQLNYWKKGPQNDYSASFVGYFPAENPKFSCIVVINKPKKEIGYYGSKVAAPIFGEIAEKMYASIPMNDPNRKNVENRFNLASKKETFHFFQTKTPFLYMPNLKGAAGMDVIPELENLGFNVQFIGSGRIITHFPDQGSKISPKQTIYLQLES